MAYGDDETTEAQAKAERRIIALLNEVLAIPVGEPDRIPPKVRSVLRYFRFEHLPQPMRGVSARFALLAIEIEGAAPDHPETYAALRKLLEAKDCAVRAVLP